MLVAVRARCRILLGMSFNDRPAVSRQFVASPPSINSQVHDDTGNLPT
jgi:hypothetical protein